LITADQLVAHAVGDYVLQSDWMANEKTKKSVAALVHVATYALPFLFITRSIPALAVIISTHFVIDRWRLARYVCWVKNFLAPHWTTILIYPATRSVPKSTEVSAELPTPTIRVLDWWPPWSECSATGYHQDRPVWMSVWLMIITDNIIHVVINSLAIKYL